MTNPAQSTLISVEATQVTVNGRQIAVPEGDSPHAAAISEVARTIAAPLGQPISAIAREGGHETSMTIHPDGRATINAPSASPPTTMMETFLTAESGAHRPDRPSFITAGRSVQPAIKGWRGTLNSAGLRLSPGPAEQSERADVDAVARHWPGTRTVAVVNAKGSASKTPTVACLSAIFARLGGSGVLAWDNNETEGTLRFRTEWTSHRSTMLDLLPQVDQLLSPSAAVAQMSNYVHHQPADKYDVLWSDTTVDGDHLVSGEDVHEIHRVASRYYRMIVMDSGNNARAANWRAMIDQADALVVPCTEVEDTAEVGARLLEALLKRGGRSAELAHNATVLVSQRTLKGQNMDRIVEGFQSIARAVVRIPYDPALETGVIRHDALDTKTQRAWLRAAAVLSEAL